MAQAEFMRDMQGASTQAEQESLRMEAMKKIVEAEKMEEKRRRKATKIAHMVRVILVLFTTFNINFQPRLVTMTL
jgi:DNA topoisomerase 2-associated protein PAT1